MSQSPGLNPYEPPRVEQPIHDAPVQAQSSAEPAGFAIRACARFIDMLVGMVLGFLGGIVGAIVVGLFAGMGMVSEGWATRLGQFSFGNLAMSMLGTLAYHTLAESMSGATVGKAVLGLRVRTTSFGPCGVGAAILRNLLYYIDALFFGLVAWSSMSKSPMLQRVGDKSANTVVVYGRSLVSGTGQNLFTGIVVGIVAQATIDVAGTVLHAM